MNLDDALKFVGQHICRSRQTEVAGYYLEADEKAVRYFRGELTITINIVKKADAVPCESREASAPLPADITKFGNSDSSRPRSILIHLNDSKDNSEVSTVVLYILSAYQHLLTPKKQSPIP